jgi:SAM-dependent methyltransferase
MRKPTERFDRRVESYVRSRPSYPTAVMELLEEQIGLVAGWTVADIGSGTGILSRLFLDRGCRVFGVEPNAEMRRAGEALLSTYRLFTSVSGTAEQTSLPDASVDLVAAGQAYHWFDPKAAREEFTRILRPEGWVVLVWNDRRRHGSAFLRAYEGLLIDYGTDYQEVDHSRLGPEELGSFFGGGSMFMAAFANCQSLDFEGLKGRLLSSSYTPGPDHPNHTSMLRTLRAIFEAHAVDDRVDIDYDTRVYYGQLT